MSLPFVQQDSGLAPSDELKELVLLPEVMGSTSFFSTSGRVYRLFGSEDVAYSIPEIPAIPPVLAYSQLPNLSLEEALQQIETFAQPTTTSGGTTESDSGTEESAPSLTVRTAECVCYEPTHQVTLPLFQALGTSAVPERQTYVGTSLKLVKSENSPSIGVVSAKDAAYEISQFLPTVTPGFLPTPTVERRQPLRVVPDQVDEQPFIVPFTIPESPPKETETKSVALKIVAEPISLLKVRNKPILSKVLKKCVQYRHRRKEKTFYRKRFVLPPLFTSPTMELLTASELKLPVNPSLFQWSPQLVSLMQTAGDQIRMLTDHLAVQENQGMKVICFKSVFPGDGCSTILLCAVRALLERDYRILLIDTHHRHIDIPKQLNLSGNLETGREVIAVNDHLGLWVWHESKTTKENTALLAEIIASYREEYDLILLDDGSVTESPLTEFVAFWNQLELSGVVLVSNTKRPSETPISHIAGRLRQHHIPLIGIAENYV